MRTESSHSLDQKAYRLQRLATRRNQSATITRSDMQISIVSSLGTNLFDSRDASVWLRKNVLPS